jgi:hypothetical protein
MENLTPEIVIGEEESSEDVLITEDNQRYIPQRRMTKDVSSRLINPNSVQTSTDIDEIKSLLFDSEMPKGFKENRRHKGLTEAELTTKRDDFLKKRQVTTVAMKNKFLLHRTQRSYDHSKRKAPPLPKTPPPILEPREPKELPMDYNEIREKLLIIRDAQVEREYGRTKVPDKKGPFYEEEFKAGHPPVHLPSHPKPIEITNHYLVGIDTQETLPFTDPLIPQLEFLKMIEPRTYPPTNYTPIPVEFTKIIEDRPSLECITYAEASKCIKKSTKSSKNGIFSPSPKPNVLGFPESHTMTVSPFFLTFFSSKKKKKEKCSSPIITQPSSSVTPILLPSLVPSKKNPLLGVITGTDRHRKVNFETPSSKSKPKEKLEIVPITKYI